MIDSSTSASGNGGDYALQLQAYLSGGNSTASGGSGDAVLEAPTDSFVQTQAVFEPATYSALSSAAPIQTIAELGAAVQASDAALASAQVALDALRNVSIADVAAAGNALDRDYKAVQLSTSATRDALLQQYQASKTAYDTAFVDYFAYAQALNNLGIAAAEYQQAYERYMEAISIKMIEGEPDLEGINVAWLKPNIPKRPWIDTSYDKEVQSTEMVDYGQWVTKTDTRRISAGHYEDDYIVTERTETRWVETSHVETYDVTESYEYSYYSHTDVETVYVSAGHYEEVYWTETYTTETWVDESYSYDVEHMDYGGSWTETVYVHTGYWDVQEHSYQVSESVWVDDSYEYDVYTDVYATGTRTETRQESRVIVTASPETVTVSEVQVIKRWVDDSYDETYEYQVYETGQRLVTTTSTVRVKAGHVEGTNISVDGTDVSGGSWLSSMLNSIDRWVGGAVDAVSAIGNSILSGGSPSPQSVVNSLLNSANAAYSTSDSSTVPQQVFITGYRTPGQRLDDFIASIYPEIGSWGAGTVPDWAAGVNAITPPVYSTDLMNDPVPLGGGFVFLPRSGRVVMPKVLVEDPRLAAYFANDLRQISAYEVSVGLERALDIIEELPGRILETLGGILGPSNPNDPDYDEQNDVAMNFMQRRNRAMGLLATRNDLLQAASIKYNVHPSAIAAAITWEFSMNPRGYMSDTLGGYVQNGYGWGQIHDSTLRTEMLNGISLAESVELRKNLDSAIDLVAMRMNQQATTYQTISGINLRNDVTALSWLYNTSADSVVRSAETQAQAIANGQIPSLQIINDMAYWTNANVGLFGFSTPTTPISGTGVTYIISVQQIP